MKTGDRITPEEFISVFYDKVITANTEIYRDMYINGFEQETSDPFIIRAFRFVSKLSKEDRGVLLAIMRQVMIDTSSNIFGIFDGISDFHPYNKDFKILYNDGNAINGDLQGLFLEKDEENI